ncbi:hypothetical protein JQ615_17210 [Bradyrhizobium jicamae]|uniref:Uncharacterized protein n=1 Tax=Bradyrhizobium jicamae TaxID=280332 RepID=A0ABS5FK40_9BRAD|nr:hypothetical protein [Bradyrhizobium jicamae]MBR0797133.1 hypothetical protein [Bradyrhizobium jicamae]
MSKPRGSVAIILSSSDHAVPAPVDVLKSAEVEATPAFVQRAIMFAYATAVFVAMSGWLYLLGTLLSKGVSWLVS